MATIVVAVLNGESVLDSCLESCVSQDYAAKEIVVVDGGSTDGTVDVIRKHASSLAWWVSERDGGIYHAWNKALRASSGEWVCFLGADDVWRDSTSLSRMMSAAVYPDVNFVSGVVRKVGRKSGHDSLFGEPWNYQRMKTRMTVAHSGTLHHRTLFEKFGEFDEDYRIAGDFEFLLRAGKDVRGAFVDSEVAVMGGGGVSSRMLGTVYREGIRALTFAHGAGPIYGFRFAAAFAVWRLLGGQSKK